ncbi:MAG: phytoene desaturase [Flavobacteriales bacterium]|nr:phytoene desaturase [Flavobacteriales bacterium]
MKKTVIVIGSGFAGLAAAASLAQKGYGVTVLEKNPEPGGRARVLKESGFVFDMGPSFYWMPDVFDRFFGRFGQKASDHYELVRLDPSYSIVFGAGDTWAIPAQRGPLREFFERHEPGAGAALDRFLHDAGLKYDMAMGDLVYKPGLSWLEYARPDVLMTSLRTKVFRSLRKHVRAHFKDQRLRSLMEFPVLFLGASPQNTPALYSLMNYADLELGTWYPMGGMGRVVDAMMRVATQQGVEFRMNEPVSRIAVDHQARVTGVETASGMLDADIVVAGADYHHVEQALLAEQHRSYSLSYWSKRIMAPSALQFYLGFDRRLDRLAHHTLFFDEPLDLHSAEIYDTPRWPSRPLFYTSCTSRTDPATAPAGHENLVVLIPVAPGLEDTDAIRQQYFSMVMERLGRHLGFDPKPHLVYQRSYCINDLRSDYNAFRGNAYGLANTLMQTGPLRPSVKSKRVKGLYFTGQLSVPGPGVPPALISGQLVADLIHTEQQTA